MHERGEAGEARAKLAAAEGAYDGEFLEEDAYEDWAVPLREEVRMTFIWVSRALAEMAERSAAIDDANRHYLRILEKDPWDQGAHLALVRALERAGRHGEARRRYRAYVSRMEEIDLPFAPFPITQRP
jgi:DNA-binding SARP family transcriptional activator